jgi:lysine-specific demethylase/histidyl-hydroxylase NO66
MTRPEAGALERCVGSGQRFLDRFWMRTPLHHRSPGGQSFDDLLTLSGVDHILSTMSLRTPAFRLVKDGATLDPGDYTKTGRTGSTDISGLADPARIFQQFQRGATIVLQGMHRYWAPLARFCRELELVLSHPTQANAYITPPGSRGLAVHCDSHDVFVLQAFGRKSWAVFEPEEHGGRVSNDTERDPTLSVELEPGDCLYIPRGAPHSARTQETVSGHLTVGILSYTWARLFRDVFKQVESEPEFLEPLPVGFYRHPEAFEDAIEDRLAGLRIWLDKADAGELAARMIRKFLTTRQPLMEGGLAGLLELDSLSDQTTMRRRHGSICVLRLQGDRLHVLLGDRELEMPARAHAAMSLVAGRGEFEVGELAELLDGGGRLVLARRLVQEGLLEVAGEPDSHPAGG